MSASIFFFNDTATTEIYTLSLHDALPIYLLRQAGPALDAGTAGAVPEPRRSAVSGTFRVAARSEEHTSELQSHVNLVCRLLLEKKNITHNYNQCQRTSSNNFFQ